MCEGQESPVRAAEVVLWIDVDHKLSTDELRLITAVSQAALGDHADVKTSPFVNYYHDDGTKS